MHWFEFKQTLTWRSMPRSKTKQHSHVYATELSCMAGLRLNARCRLAQEAEVRRSAATLTCIRAHAYAYSWQLVHTTIVLQRQIYSVASKSKLR